MDVSKEKKRILKAAQDVMLEEIGTYGKYSLKTGGYSTIVDYCVVEIC